MLHRDIKNGDFVCSKNKVGQRDKKEEMLNSLSKKELSVCCLFK